MKLNRENKLLIGLCTAAGILILKLFSIQIIEDKYKLSAENNTMVYSTPTLPAASSMTGTATSLWATELHTT